MRDPLEVIEMVAVNDKEAAWQMITRLSEMTDGIVLTPSFDYTALDASIRDFIQQKTGEIRAIAKRAAEDIIAIGKALIEVKEHLKHGKFGEWLQAEFGWSIPTATNFMQVARRFGENRNYYEFAPTVLYMFAAPSTPDPAIAEAITLLQSGKKVDVKTAKEIIHRHKSADEAAAIDLIIDTAPKGKLTNALNKTHIQAVATVAKSLAATGTVNGTTTLAQALKPAVIQESYEATKRQEEYVVAKQDAKLAKQLDRHIAKDTPPVDWDASNAWRLLDCSVHQAIKEVEAGSVDWIITDPPYSAEFLSLYADLSHLASHALKPGGSLLCLTGQSVLPAVMNALGTCLKYHWTLAYTTPGGQAAQMWKARVNNFWKPVLWYVKDEYAGDWVGDVVKSEVNHNEKELHHWQQSESGFADLMQRFVYPGQLVLDPFTGASTTGVVALRLKCHFIGMDIDKGALNTSRERLIACTTIAAPDLEVMPS